MRSCLFLAFCFLFLASCGGNGDKKDKGSPVTGDADLSNNPDYQKGIELLGKNDCLTCHKIDEKLNGPSYRDVANKYANNPDTIIRYLAGKVISGGKGTWGEVYMTPHAGLSLEDAEAMVKYIMLLKK